MPNEVTRLAKYVNTMKANPAIAQKESQQPVDGIAALAAQMYNSAPKPKAPVSYPEGTALMKATAQTPAQASGGLAEIFSQAAKNPKLAPYVEHLVELAKRFKAENPDASEEELGKAVFSSAPPEIKQAILNLAYEHVGGEQGMARGGKVATDPFSDESLASAKQSYLDKVSEQQAKNRYKEKVAESRKNLLEEQAYQQRKSEVEARRIAEARKNAPFEIEEMFKPKSNPNPVADSNKRLEEFLKQPQPKTNPLDAYGEQDSRALKKEEAKVQQKAKLNELGQQGSEAAKAKSAPAKQSTNIEEALKLRKEQQGPVRPMKEVNTAILDKPAESTAPKVSGGSKVPLTKADYDKIPLKEKIGKIAGPFAGLVNKFLQAGLTGEQAYQLYNTYNKVQSGELPKDAFGKEAAKLGVNLAATGLSAIPHPVPQIAGFGLGLAGDKLIDNADEIAENWEAYKRDFKDMLGFGGEPAKQAEQPATPATGIATVPKPDGKPSATATGVAAVAPKPQAKSNMLSGIPSQIPAEQYGPPAPIQDQQVTYDAAPQQPQYDESLPDQAVQKIMSLYATPQYSSQIMEMLKQGKRNEMLNTALGMLAGTGAGLSQRNMNEGLSQANLLAGNAFTSGMDRANQAEHEWMKAQIANEMAPIDMRNKAVDAYLGMQGKAADRAAMLQHYDTVGQYDLLRQNLANRGALDAAELRAAGANKELQQKRMWLQSQAKNYRDIMGVKDKDLTLTPEDKMKDPDYAKAYYGLLQIRAQLDQLGESELGLAGGTGMGEQAPTHEVMTLGDNGKLIPQTPTP